MRRDTAEMFAMRALLVRFGFPADDVYVSYLHFEREKHMTPAVVIRQGRLDFVIRIDLFEEAAPTTQDEMTIILQAAMAEWNATSGPDREYLVENTVARERVVMAAGQALAKGLRTRADLDERRKQSG